MSKILKRLFFNKFRVKKLICTTKFSSVYEGIYEKENEPVAMKFEEKLKYRLLENEAYYLYILKGIGIPRLISYGKTNLFNILIEELLGKSILQIWNSTKIKKEYKLKNVCMIAIQILERLEFIHSKNIIHKDIKPQNFIPGRKDPKIIYLIDFGFAQKYRSSRTGKHINYKFLNKVDGSLLYLSTNAIKGYEQSRRDDLESLGYMLIHLMIYNLPWMHIYSSKIDYFQKIKKILNMKIAIKPEVLCKGLPEEFEQYIKYCRTLNFEKDPDYNYLRGLFITILIKNQLNNNFNFIWVKNNKKLKSRKEGEFTDRRNIIHKKKESSVHRLYSQIKESLEKKKLLEKIKININLDNKSNSYDNSIKIINNHSFYLKKNNNINNFKNIYKHNLINSVGFNEMDFTHCKPLNNFDKKNINNNDKLNFMNSSSKIINWKSEEKNRGLDDGDCNRYNINITKKFTLNNKKKFNNILTSKIYINNNFFNKKDKKYLNSNIDKQLPIQKDFKLSYNGQVNIKFNKIIDFNNNNKNNKKKIIKMNNEIKINNNENIKKNSIILISLTKKYFPNNNNNNVMNKPSVKTKNNILKVSEDINEINKSNKIINLNNRNQNSISNNISYFNKIENQNFYIPKLNKDIFYKALFNSNQKI